MRVLLWHVHGSWTDAFVRGDHEYLLPVLPDRGPNGRGRARTWTWPDTVREVPPERLVASAPDVVVLQRPHEARLLRGWTGLRAGQDVAAAYVEHNTPPSVGHPHPLAGQSAVPLVHVTHFNQLMWDSGDAPCRVIEHGVPDPGHRYRGEIERGAVVVNDPLRRGRPVGADLVRWLAPQVPLDVFGMRVAPMAEEIPVRPFEDLPQRDLHDLLPHRRLYLHPYRWTSLGLALIEAMLLGMPVVGLDTTEASRTVRPRAGFLSNDPRELATAARRLLDDAGLAHDMGRAAREIALERHSLARFLSDWDETLAEVRAGVLQETGIC